MVPYLIAEVGINHNGDLDITKQLISAAHGAGFDAVKFQKRTLDLVYPQDELNKPRESPWGTTTRDQKQGLEFGLVEYREIDNFCRDLGIAWSASAWDLEALAFLKNFELPFHKIASARLGHFPLLAAIASEGKKTFISTGMTSVEEIDAVVLLFQKANCPFELMHCNSTYPMKDHDANLSRITMLQERYQCDVGYSGHEVSLIKVCVAATALGATSIERHITLDRTMYGSDQAASINLFDLKMLVSDIKTVKLALGNPEKRVMETEVPIKAKLRKY